MRTLLRWLSGRYNDRNSPRRRPSALAIVETLEGRQLPSGLHGIAELPGQIEVRDRGRGNDDDNRGRGNGDDNRGRGNDNRNDDRRGRRNADEVRKSPRFYEFYIGPRRADLNVIAAEVKLEAGKRLVFRGTMQGKIDKTPASSADDSIYVFGVNRGSPGAIAPFFNRPGIAFDSVVVVSVTHDAGITASVLDFATGAATPLSPNLVKIEGREVRVTVDPALLPTPAGGKPLRQYTFNLWPRSSLANPTPTAEQPHPSFVASFIPENRMAPIQLSRGRGR